MKQFFTGKPVNRGAALLLAGALLLSGCGKKSVPAAAPQQTLGGSGSVPEAYLVIEPPEHRGEGTPAYWPPNYQKEEEPVSSPVQMVPAATGAQGEYHTTSVSLTPVSIEGSDDELYSLQGSDYLISAPVGEEANTKTAILNRVQQLKALNQEFPDIPFFTYFIERATDCDWYADTEGIRAYDYASYFEQQLGGDGGIAFGRFAPTDLQDYMDTGYKLDFHLNHIGADRVYQDIYRMLSGKMEMTPLLRPVREMDYDNLFCVGQLFSHPADVVLPEEKMDVFRTYQYDLGEYDSYVGDKKMVVGMEEEYASGQIDRTPSFQHLFSFYGGQADVVRFDFHQPERPNLLMLSDSQGRPIRKLLASHFNRTVYFDMEQLNSMDVAQTIRDEDIGVIVMVGQLSLFERFS